MKRIVLKPELKTKTWVMFEDKKLFLYDQDEKRIILTEDIHGNGFTITILKTGFDILESPGEQDHIGDANKMVAQVADADSQKKNFIEGQIHALECLWEHFNYFKPTLGRIYEIIEGNISVFKKHLEQVAEAGKEKTDKLPDGWQDHIRGITDIEIDKNKNTEKQICNHIFEGNISVGKRCLSQNLINQLNITGKPLPSLRLRVGGVYRNRRGDIIKIDNFNSNPKERLNFIDENGFSFRIDGTYRYYGNCDVPDSPYDLIEEVQPEQDAVEYCQCDTPTYHAGKCVDCNKKVKEKTPVDEKDGVEKKPKTRVVIERECEEQKPTAQEKVAVNYILPPFSPPPTTLQIADAKIGALLKENEKLKKQLQKPEGNPFKVGETIEFFYSHFGEERSNFGVITKKPDGMIDDQNILYVKVDNEDRFTTIHYKQCEKVKL